MIQLNSDKKSFAVHFDTFRQLNSSQFLKVHPFLARKLFSKTKRIPTMNYSNTGQSVRGFTTAASQCYIFIIAI